MNILITAIGSFSADCVINTLKKNGHKVIGTDIYPREWHAVSNDCYKVYKAPLATKEKEYIDFLLQVTAKENINCIIPLTDLEIDIINKNRERFKKDIILCMQSANTLKIARNKLELSKIFQFDENINIPYFTTSKELKENFKIPAIAKPFNGRSSEGIIKINTKNDFDLVADKKKYIIQEFIQGNIFTIDYIRDNFGNDFSIPREELLRTKNGAGITVRIDANTKLINAASYIGNKINIIGCVNMEFIKSNNNKYYLIDINPRFSAGIAYSNFIGYDMITSNINCFMNKPIQEPIKYKNQILCKRYKEEIIS